MSRLSGLLIPVVLASAFVSGSAWSEDKGASRERESLRRAQQQVKQIGQEKAALEEKLTGFEQDKAKLLNEKEKLIGGAQARVKSAIAKRDQLQLALNAMTQEKANLQSQKAEVDQRLAELSAKQAATERDLALAKVQTKQTESTLSTRDQQVASCEDKNRKLYQHGRDLISQCRDQSATDVVLRLEPFTGIKRVGTENVLEEYRDKVDAQKVQAQQ
jgi:chromosome segregation ATPase